MKKKLSLLVSSIFMFAIIFTSILAKADVNWTGHYDDVLVGTTNLNNTTDNSAKWGDQLLKPEKGWKRYDDTNSLIKKNVDVSTILQEAKPVAYKGTVTMLNVGSSGKIEFNFTGEKLRLIGTLSAKFEESTGFNKPAAYIYIDGKSYGDIINYADRNGTWQTLLGEYKVSKGIHKVEIFAKSENIHTTYDLDAIDVDGELVKVNEDKLAKLPTEFNVINREKNLELHMNAVNQMVGFNANENPSNQWTFTPVGDYYVITNVRTNLQLHVNAVNQLVGFNASDNTSNQWKLVSVGGGYYNIINARTGLQLHMENNYVVTLQNNPAHPSNQWKLNQTTPRPYNLISKKSNKELHMGATNNVTVWDEHENPSDQWRFYPVGDKYVIENVRTNLQLHVNSVNQLAAFNASDNPSNQWELRSLGNDYYSIRNVRTGLYIRITDSGSLELSSNASGDNIQWKLQFIPAR